MMVHVQEEFLNFYMKENCDHEILLESKSHWSKNFLREIFHEEERSTERSMFRVIEKELLRVYDEKQERERERNDIRYGMLQYK